MSSAPLRIAFVVLHTSPLDEPGTKDAGGMNVVVRAQAAELARRGHQVQLITRRADADQPAEIDLAPNLVLHHLNVGPARLLPKGEHEGLMVEFGEALLGHLREHPVDVIHAEHWFSGIAAVPAARALGVPLVQSFHSIAADPSTPLTEGERPESPGRQAGEQLLAHEADLVIAVSAAERHTVLERLRGDPARVRVVPLGVDTTLFHPCETAECAEQRDWLARGGRPEVLVAGRLHPLKGFDLAVAAVALIEVDQRPILRIIGAPPPDGDEYVRSLHEAIADADMLSTVAFEGALRRRELAERIRRAEIVLVPSHSETFGLVALEASSCGVPVIARDTGGLREAVVDGETGMLLDSNDPAEWARAIASLLRDRERAAKMGAAARSHALRHDWASTVDRLLDAYRSVLGARIQ